jgi:hypothetical protein
MCAWVLLIPPNEGFDEFAHLSYIKAQGNGYGLKDKENVFLDQNLIDYSSRFPVSANWPEKSIKYDEKYSENNMEGLYREGSEYIPSEKINWQIQHPPTYYWLLNKIAPNYFKSIKSEVLFYRLISILFVFLGFIISSLCIIRVRNEQISFVLYLIPMIFPMFIIEYARIGNDSLFFLALSILVYMLVLENESSSGAKKLSLSLAIGVIVGLLVTIKLFALSIIASIIIYSVVKRKPIILFACAASAALSWMLMSSYWMSHEFFFNTTSIQFNFDWSRISKFFYWLLSFLGTFLWAGTWSLYRISDLPLLVSLYLLIKFISTSQFYDKIVEKESINILFYLIIIFFIAIFFAQIASQAFTKAEIGVGTGGWYLYIIIMPIMLLFYKKSIPADKFKTLLSISMVGIILQTYHYIELSFYYGGTLSKQHNFFLGLDVLDILSVEHDTFASLLLISYPFESLMLFIGSMILSAIYITTISKIQSK